jgi:hypothetical protein
MKARLETEVGDLEDLPGLFFFFFFFFKKLSSHVQLCHLRPLDSYFYITPSRNN